MNETQKRFAEKHMERLTAEREAFIDAHTKRLSGMQNERANLIGSLTVAAIRADGPPVDVEKFALGIEALVDRLSAANRRKQFEELKALLKEINVHALAPDVVWAAKQAGVTLFDEPASPKLVTEG